MLSKSYTIGGTRHINLGGGNKNLGGTISESYKSGEAPMVKIKDFPLASKNLGGHVPPVPYSSSAHDIYSLYIYVYIYIYIYTV